MVALVKIHDHLHISSAPSCRSDVSGKVWPELITTQQAGIYPAVSFGFGTRRGRRLFVLSAYIYAHRAQRVEVNGRTVGTQFTFVHYIWWVSAVKGCPLSRVPLYLYCLGTYFGIPTNKASLINWREYRNLHSECGLEC